MIGKSKRFGELDINLKSHEIGTSSKKPDKTDFSFFIDKKRQAEQVVRILAETYPDADCTLDYQEPWKLLISGILAAQCTDARVNVICSTLFVEFPTIESIADADLLVLEDRIRSCGFFHMKAKAIKGSMSKILEDFNGQVPSTLEELTSLPGVGRKIGNLILGDCFGIQSVVVDTHCSRISKHLGLTDSVIPARIEQDLMQCLPAGTWTSYGHRIVAHGRAICTARNPRCAKCPLRHVCKKGMESIE